MFEIGTWRGGGSTYFIARALADNGSGLLYTIEADLELFEEAVRSYDKYLPELRPYVRFHDGSSTDVYPALLDQIGGVDALFLDGAEDAEQTLNEFKMFEPFMAEHAVLILHDWETEKMRLLRTLIEGSDDWVVNHEIGPPRSVGLVVCSRRHAPLP